MAEQVQADSGTLRRPPSLPAPETARFQIRQFDGCCLWETLASVLGNRRWGNGNPDRPAFSPLVVELARRRHPAELLDFPEGSRCVFHDLGGLLLVLDVVADDEGPIWKAVQLTSHTIGFSD